MTKKELIDEIDSLASEFLGCKVNSSLSSRKKDWLENKVARYRIMMDKKRKSDHLLSSFSEEQILAFTLSPDLAPKEFVDAVELRSDADELWLSRE